MRNVVVFNPRTYDKEAIRQHLFRHARIPLSRFGERTLRGLKHRREIASSLTAPRNDRLGGSVFRHTLTV